VSIAAAGLCEPIRAIAVLTLGSTVRKFLLVFLAGGGHLMGVAVCRRHTPVRSDRRPLIGGFVVGRGLLNEVLCFYGPTYPMIRPIVFG